MRTGRQLAVKEMKRILKPHGLINMSLGGSPPFGYVDKTEWGKILAGFIIKRGGDKEQWVVLSVKQEQ